jgi:hypothetical protein
MDGLERLGWYRLTSHKYRHYCGAVVTKRGKLWDATTVNGIPFSGHKTELEAAAYLEQNDPSFWTYGRSCVMGLCGGVVNMIGGRLDGYGTADVFVFYSQDEQSFPMNQVRSAFEKYFWGKATCVKCLRPMVSLLLRVLPEFHGKRISKNAYLACGCGHPVWRLDSKLEFAAHSSILSASYSSQRRQSLKIAGGTHNSKEIEEILAIQENRCIYCNVNFTKEVRPTKDHLLPVSVGGTNWALNIVLACKSCNSRRGDIPFRTYCRLLSRTQNQRILIHLGRRLLALDEDHIVDEALVDFHIGFAYHDSQHGRYRDILSMSATRRRNATTNQLLPPTESLILKKYKKYGDKLDVDTQIVKLQNKIIKALTQ